MTDAQSARAAATSDGNRWLTAFASLAVGCGVLGIVSLRKKFGADYEEYCRNVRRWWPRVRGWDKPQ
jgi:hypothetical protein